MVSIQFVKFSLIGVVNTVIQYVVFVILFRYMGLWMLFSSAIGYCLGVLNSFIMNRKWTFNMPKSAGKAEFFKFVLVNFVSLLINLAVLYLFVEMAGILPEIAQIIAIIVSLLVNFTGNKWWTFRQERLQEVEF